MIALIVPLLSAGFLSLASAPAYAEEGWGGFGGLASLGGGEGVSIRVEPIAGYEKTMKSEPSPHSSSRLILGARVIAGYRILSAEGEYTRGSDSETPSNVSYAVSSVKDNFKLGLRSSVLLGGILSAHARAGGQASSERYEWTRNGQVEKTAKPLAYHPYAGAGFSASLGGQLSASGDITAIFNDTSDLSKNDYQTTFGISMHVQ